MKAEPIWSNSRFFFLDLCFYFCFHVFSCMEVIWSQSSVSFRTGCRSSHCIKAEQMVRMKRRMKRRDWWENTRYCGWTVVCLSVCCLSEKCSWIHTLHPQGSFLVYPIDSGDEEDTKCQITSGIPKNSAIKVLVRVYIVKVPVCLSIYILSLSLIHLHSPTL